MASRKKPNDPRMLQRARDLRKDATVPERYLESQGLRVLRISNDDVLKDREAVALAILRAAGIALQ